MNISFPLDFSPISAVDLYYIHQAQVSGVKMHD